VRKLVAIHQPNFLPWLGFFDKLARADVFVLLDDVQFPRTSKGTWINRVKLLVAGKATWMTVPIVRSAGSTRAVREVQIDDSQPWRKKLLRTVEVNYRRAPYFDEVFPFVEELVTRPTDQLAGFNEANIRRLAEELGLDTAKLVHSSEIKTVAGGTELLVELTRAVGGTAYLSGGLAPEAYQDDAVFAAAEVELVFQDFRHPTYPQRVDEPVHGLSIVDALMNCGVAGTAALVAATAVVSR
jgi:WbqC-like protein family